MKTQDFLLIDGDGDAMIDAMSEHFTAKVLPVCNGNFYKIELQTENDYFNAGIYQERDDAEREVKRLYKTLKDFKKGKLKDIDGFMFAESDVSALELLSLFEIYNELGTANNIAVARMATVDDCLDCLDEFLDNLRRDNLRKKSRCD